MLNPAIGELIENYDSRYQLVLDVAKKAREISEAAEAKGDIIIEKPVSLAIDKLSNEMKGISEPEELVPDEDEDEDEDEGEDVSF